MSQPASRRRSRSRPLHSLPCYLSPPEVHIGFRRLLFRHYTCSYTPISEYIWNSLGIHGVFFSYLNMSARRENIHRYYAPR